ncbi:MAG: TonB-dependent siderophore receptor [Novosphingobium sp.]|nr:TonB-dependent siderophore receptor [Novosphingobium sp.]MCP5401520.1 TonB-dependent siderophore receptor [Novosphingobium sp.]
MYNLNSCRFGLAAAASATALAAASPALAEEQPDRDYAPSDIIVSAKWAGYAADDGSTSTKTPTPLIDTPQAVSVLTRDQLDDQNVRQLGDALRYVAGISMESGEGHRDEVFIRGQETTADFFLNGLRDDAQYYRPLYNVERIEVLKGANALTFGRGGGGGVINRVSKTANPLAAFANGDASLDTFGAFALTADVNQPFSGNAGARLSATYEEFDNHRDFYDGRFFGISPTVTANLGENTRLILGYSYDDDRRVTDRGVPSLDGRPLAGFDRAFFGDPDFNEARSQVHIGRFRLDHDFSEALSVNLTGQYADYDKVYANIVPASTDGTSIDLNGYRDTTKRENWILQGNLVWQGSTGAIGHTLLAGFEAMRQDTRNARNNAEFDTAGGPVGRVSVPLARRLALPPVSLTPLVRDRDSELTAFSAYLQDQIAIGDMLQLIAGVRFESFDLETTDLLSATPAARKDTKWSPRFGVVVKPQENLSVYASYTQSFLPQAGDQFLILSPTAATLAPEKFENIEAGVKWALRKDLLFTAAVFQLERSNSQATDPLNPGFVVLTGKSRTRGVELQLAGDLASNWHANIGYTYLDGEIRSDTSSAPAGTVLEQVPKHHIAAWTRYDFSERFGLGAGVIHSSKQFASLSNSVELPAYTRIDMAAYFEASDRLSFQLNVENLFDEQYYPSAHGNNNIQPAKPLNASLSARFSF